MHLLPEPYAAVTGLNHKDQDFLHTWMGFCMFNQALKQPCLSATFALQYDYVKTCKIHISFYVERIKNNKEAYFVSQTTANCGCFPITFP